MKFDELNIDERILRAVEDMGFEETSPIQTQAIPAVLEGIDVIGQAQTGTGKTAAYSIPMLQKINPDVKKPQAIVLCPTRELAVQVAEEIRKLAKYMSDIKVLPVYGGQEIVRQIKSLKAGVQIIVGTPGRVMDHMRRKTVKFDSVSMVILDEADEMLDMGFREDMETILTETPEERQTVLFSATMPKPIMEIARKFQKDAKIIKVVRKELTVSNIDQFYYEVRPKNKTEILSRLIDIYNPKLSVVFCNTKRQVDELISELKGRGYFADGIHGDMKQQQRDRVMDDFRSGKTEILIATDVAARGIDVDGVDIVFNYDLPQDEEYYVHRIGRTGRAGKSGLALSFISGREVYKLKDIEHYCKTKIKAKPIPSLDDVKNTKLEVLFEKIKETIAEGGISDMIEMVENQVYLAQGAYAKVIGRSEGLLAACAGLQYALVALHLRIQTAAAYAMLGKTEEAQALLLQALQAAEPDEFLLPFVENYRYIKKTFEKLPQTPLLARIQRLGKASEQRQKQLSTHRPASLAALTEREYEIVKLMASRLRNREIAEKLFLSEGSVKQYINQIYSKLQIEGDTHSKRKQLFQLLEEKT